MTEAILPRSHTLFHLLPRGAEIRRAAGTPAWFADSAASRSTAGGPVVQVNWGDAATGDLSKLAGLVAINGGPTDEQLRSAGFTYVRRFAVLPSLQAGRWFIPLDSPAVSSAAFALYTPFRASAKLKLAAARAMIGMGLRWWHRDTVCIALRDQSVLEREMQGLFPGRSVRLAIGSGAIGPDARRKPSIAVLDEATGACLAFAKLAGSAVARVQLDHEAMMLPALEKLPAGRLAPRRLFAGEIDGKYVVAQSPISGTPVPFGWTGAHERFIDTLRRDGTMRAAESQIASEIDAWVNILKSGGGAIDPLVAVTIAEIREALGRLEVRRTITHADFVSWNLRERPDGSLAAFDWDTALLDGLPLYDRIHYHLMGGYCVRKWSARHATNWVENLVARGAESLSPADSWVMAAVYLVHQYLKLRVQGHEASHPFVLWYREIISSLKTDAGAPAGSKVDGAAVPSLPLALGPMEDRPLVSVIITNYNYGPFVGRAIQSCLDQTYTRLEIIVVDDGSTDGSCKIIQKYVDADPRVRLLAKANSGMASSWNAGWDVCHGEVICPLDADDSFYPAKIEEVVSAFARHPQAGLAVHAMTVVADDARVVQQTPFLTRFEEGWLADRVLSRGGRWRYMPTSALGFRRELGKYVFPIDEALFRRHADAMLVTLAPLLTGVTAIERPLSYYHLHGTNNLGGSMRDRPTALKVIDFVRQTTEGVNRRLAEIGLPQRLSASQNLEFLQANLIAALCGGEWPWQLAPTFWRAARAILTDGLYSRHQKMLGIGVYGAAVLMPSAARAWWLGQALGYSPLRYRIQKLLGLRGLRGLRDETRTGQPRPDGPKPDRTPGPAANRPQAERRELVSTGGRS